ncbi:MAG TPA: anti-sigma factor [Acidimicrobiales bacterium]|nr:anti-sigma factor [Acidimicrobiales bacterium]
MTEHESDMHESMRDLVAVYALDALEESEVIQVEDHLRDCPRCRDELAAYRETAALLAYAGTPAPQGIWEKISGEIGDAGTHPAPKLSLMIGGQKRPARTWALRAAAAAAVVVLAGTGLKISHQDNRINQLTSALADQSLLRQATAVALDPAAKRLALTSPSGQTQATAAVLPDGTGYVVSEAMPALPAGRTYQLWSIVSGRAISAGLMGSHPGVTEFRLADQASTLAVTVEPAGGSARPTSEPVASGSV